MTVHRKSNWYVYLLAFGITAAFVIMAIFAFKWYLFPENTEDVGINKNGELTDDFHPTDDYNFNLVQCFPTVQQTLPICLCWYRTMRLTAD